MPIALEEQRGTARGVAWLGMGDTLNKLSSVDNPPEGISPAEVSSVDNPPEGISPAEVALSQLLNVSRHHQG